MLVPLFISVAETIDFGLDQLDTKKKIRPKLGETIAMRLRFVPSAAQLDGSGATGTGYALVTSDGDAGANLGATTSGSAGEGVELTAGVKSSAQASTAAAAAVTASNGSGKKATAMKTETATTTPSSSGKKGKKTEAAFTSLASGNKGDDTCVNL